MLRHATAAAAAAAAAAEVSLHEVSLRDEVSLREVRLRDEVSLRDDASLRFLCSVRQGSPCDGATARPRDREPLG